MVGFAIFTKNFQQNFTYRIKYWIDARVYINLFLGDHTKALVFPQLRYIGVVVYYTEYYTDVDTKCMMTCSINDSTSRIFVHVNWLDLVYNQILTL